MNYILSANPKYFDHEACFNKYGYIDWHDGGVKFNVNDIVYIHVTRKGKLEGRILFKAIAIKTQINSPNDLQNEFWNKKYKQKEYKGTYVRLELVGKCGMDDLTYSSLSNNFQYSAPQGKATKKISPELISHIEKFFVSDITNKLHDPSNDNIENKSQCTVESKDSTGSYSLDEYSYESANCFNAINKIYYGTPGCGKSYCVSHKVLKDFRKEFIFRTTFHQDFSNVDFVGQVMPIVNRTSSGCEVNYEFIPGPFTLALECAIDHPKEMVAIVIEELNRGNAASIFGDIFQLLDRIEEKTSDSTMPVGTSEYSIVNVGISNYFLTRKVNPIELKEIRIPANLFIYATMNTSDQNVFTLDTAFKRRWETEKISNVFSDDDEIGKLFIPTNNCQQSLTWKDFVECVNKYMIDKGTVCSEDKQIGKYFVSKSTLCGQDEDESDRAKKAEKFAYKVLEYIWADVAKYKHEDWFNRNINSLDVLIKEYLTNGLAVFNNNIFSMIQNTVPIESGEQENED